MCVCVSVLLLDLFQDDLRCLFSPHQVNHGDVQNAPAQVNLYKSHTTEERHTEVAGKALQRSMGYTTVSDQFEVVFSMRSDRK